MNESILWPILKQARTYALSNTEQDGNNFDVDKFEHKFAELIVRECAGICDQQERVGWNDDRKAERKLDKDLIKKHFGIE